MLFDVQFVMPRLSGDEKSVALCFLIEADNDTAAVNIAARAYPKTAHHAESIEVRRRHNPIMFRGRWFRNAKPAPDEPVFMPETTL